MNKRGHSGAQKMFARNDAIKIFLRDKPKDIVFEPRNFTTGFNMGWKFRGEREQGSVFGGHGIFRKVEKQKEKEELSTKEIAVKIYDIHVKCEEGSIISPFDIDDILETLQDNNLLNEDGKKVRHEFWKKYYKGKVKEGD